MSSLIDIVVSFLAALLSAAFLHFGASETPPEPPTDPASEAAAPRSESSESARALKFVAH